MRIIHLISIVVASSLVTFSSNLDARDGGGDSGSSHHDGDDNDDDGCQGGHIDGTETLIAKVCLVPTTNAPTGAGGKAKLEAENEDGVVTSELELVLFGLEPGLYPLSVVKKSDGSTVVLAQIQIGGTCDDDDDDGDDDGDNDDDGDDDDGDDDIKSNGHDGDDDDGVFVSSEDLELPSDLDPMDIAQIIISDANGTPLLIGDLVNPDQATCVRFKASVRVSSGTATIETTARSKKSDKALALSTARKGKRSDRFTMIASGLPANSTFTVQVNGQNAGTATSNRKGKMLIRNLPESLIMIQSVRVVDSNGQTAARANF